MPVLLICVDGSASEADAQACRSEFEVLAAGRWTYSPAFVDQSDEVPATAPDQLPMLRTVGVFVTLPEPEDTTDEDAVRRDVARLVEAFSRLAKRTGIEFAVEYRDEQVGFLDGGADDIRVVSAFFGSG